MNKQEILNWNREYDKDYSLDSAQTEKELGEKLRSSKELTKGDLVQIVEWKFKELKGRKERILKLIENNDDLLVRRVSRDVFDLTSDYDLYKVKLLCVFHGIGPAVASTILTFYNPKDYGVFDIHVWRESFGKEQKNLFTTENYLKLLAELRKLANQYGLDVRTIEKAFYKKNIDRM